MLPSCDQSIGGRARYRAGWLTHQEVELEETGKHSQDYAATIERAEKSYRDLSLDCDRPKFEKEKLVRQRDLDQRTYKRLEGEVCEAYQVLVGKIGGG